MLHRRLQNRDVEFTHVLQYYDAWEEYADSEEIRRHDSKFIQKFNQEHVEQHTELITTIDESTLDSTMSRSKERDQPNLVAILVLIRIFTDLCKVSLPNLKREVSFAIHSESDLNLSKHKDSIESWDGSDTWSSSGDESKSKSIHSSNTMDESADVRSRFTIPEGRLSDFVLLWSSNGLFKVLLWRSRPIDNLPVSTLRQPFSNAYNKP